MNLVQDNNVEDIHAASHIVRRALDIYGEPFESVRGMRNKKKLRRTDIDLLIEAEQPLPQRMYSDVLAVREQKFLMTLKPLELVLTTHVERETTEELGLVLQVRSRCFKPFVAYVDPQPALKTLQHQMNGWKST